MSRASLDLYEPINTLKSACENVWIVDGPVIEMAWAWTGLPFTTRMVVIKLSGGGLFVWSPIKLTPDLKKQVDALGPVECLISPNKLHYANLPAWQAAYPQARTWASPGVRDRARSQGIAVDFDRDLGDDPDEAWREDIDQLVFKGSRYIEEVVFLHKASRTLILADLIENLELTKVSGPLRWLIRLAGSAHPNGKMPIDLRLTFLGRKRKARACVERMIAWRPERIILAHGRWYDRNGVRELYRAFRWVGIAPPRQG